jgi:general secretion pathway protein M
MIYKLPLRLRQLLAISLLVAALGLTALLTVFPFLSQLTSVREQLVQERTTKGRLLHSSLEPAKGRLPELTKINGLSIEGESEAIRLASLQSQVMDIISAQAVKPRTTRNLQTRERNTLKLVGVQLQLTATIEQLQRILLEIEAHKPILLVDSLHLSPSASATADDDRGLVEIRMDVVGIEARPAETRQKAP